MDEKIAKLEARIEKLQDRVNTLEAEVSVLTAAMPTPVGLSGFVSTGLPIESVQYRDVKNLVLACDSENEFNRQWRRIADGYYTLRRVFELPVVDGMPLTPSAPSCRENLFYLRAKLLAAFDQFEKYHLWVQ